MRKYKLCHYAGPINASVAVFLAWHHDRIGTIFILVLAIGDYFFHWDPKQNTSYFV